MAARRRIIHTILKGILGIIIIMLTILFVIQVIVIVHFDHIIETTLKDTIRKSTGELYTLDFKNLSINVFAGSVTAEEVYLKSDTVTYNKLKEAQSAPTLIFSIYTPKLKISRVNLYNAYFDKHLEIKSIKIEKPEVFVLNEPENRPQEKARKKDPLDAYSLISQVFKKAGTDKIEIAEGSLNFKKISKEGEIAHRFSSLSIIFSEVLIDSTSYIDTTNIFYSDNIALDIKNYNIKLPDSLYILNFGQIMVSTKRAEIGLKNIELKPRHSKFQFAKVKGEQIDRISMKVNEVAFKKINLRKLLDEQQLIVDEIVVKDGEIRAFRDKQIPRKKGIKKELPQASLKKLDFLIDIKKVRVRNLNVYYEEIPEKGGEGGNVKFTNIYSRITDINNSPEAIKKGQIIWARAEGHLMGKGLIKAKFRIPLNTPLHEFSYSGTLFEMNFGEMNPVTKPLASIELKSGTIKKIDFEITANDKRAKGKMKFFYNDLKVQLLDKEKEDGGIKEKLGSFIANNFIVESDNPRNGNFREGAISFERDQERSIFNYWWKSLLSGIKPSIGLTEERQSTIYDFKKKIETRKKKKEARKKEKKNNRKKVEKK